MTHLIPSLAEILAPLGAAFRVEVFLTFQTTVAAWIACLGDRTISRVWETTGQTHTKHHAAAFRLFAQANWTWDEVMRILITSYLKFLVRSPIIWVVIDDTLCHKRGAKVAFGGIFLDPVMSTRRHKTFRFGNNWVLLGLIVRLPFCPQRHFCVPLLWRLFEKRGQKTKAEHRTKAQLATEMLVELKNGCQTRRFASWAMSLTSASNSSKTASKA